jgi:hypothetical protein
LSLRPAVATSLLSQNRAKSGESRASCAGRAVQARSLGDGHLVAAEADFDAQWRLIVEFLKEYHQEPAGVRLGLLEDTPGPVGDERWDVLFAGLAEHLAMRDGQTAPGWSVTRGLRRFWFPFDTPGTRAQALVHAPAAFRRRGVFVADYKIDAA